MVSFKNLKSELEETTIAQRIGIPHDECRNSYALVSNTVRDFDEFSRLIGDYYNHHFTKCVSNGGDLPMSKSIGRAKKLLVEEYRRRGGDIVTAYNDCHDGTNGGVRAVLDLIAERIKADALEDYIRDVFDRYVTPNSWEDKVEIIRRFIAHCGKDIFSSIRADQPERYAQNYEELIRSYVMGLQQTFSIFRRL